ncbi:MAG: NAD-dependent epimerase/dehydratase family protein [Candidatus Lokiarchaeota archaeon]|nr:NAD-dependent epimerase/dehydratase family protein [Candidatus Lokiarchaeota archaeon]
MGTPDILITGATGFIGTNVTLQAIEKGYSVRAFGLKDSITKYINVPGVEIVYGDITVASSIEKAMKGIDKVIHVAGDTSWWSKLVSRQRRINIDGVRNVMNAAIKQKVKKVVHTGTAATIGINPHGLTDETWSNYNIAHVKYEYSFNKRKGDEIVIDAVKKGLEATIISPGGIMGPYDFTLQFGRIFLNIRDKKLPGIPSGGQSWGHVSEVAKAHINALDLGKSGERYICAGPAHTYKEVFEEIACSIDRELPTTRVFSQRTAVLLGHLMEFISKFTNNPPQLSPSKARWMSQFPRYDSSKAVRELGYTIYPLRKIVEDARDWYIGNGFL